ncbi:MAG: hypothetical protein ACU0DT_00815 [Albimonas sp.]|uniref:hypothetical protein n=1 Tax=Albimonas sp. TaxID=1872425 RepID=UPI004055C348
MTKTRANQQLGFDAFLAEADVDNRARRFEKEAAHLPGDFDQALKYLRRLIESHHVAMLAADVDEVFRLREEAVRLAVKLNGGESGILASEDAPGYRLSEATKAEPGRVPLWGQQGDFVIPIRGMETRIEMCGLYGIGVSTFFFWPGFEARAVRRDRPFFSETGYRSFLGIHADAVPGLTPDVFAAKVIERHIETMGKGRRS